jgi:hypothetical protein
MEVNMAKKSIISASYENGTLSFVVGEAGTLNIEVANLAPAIAEKALLHGLVQKVSDAAAMPKDELTGNPKKDAALKFEAMAAVVERLTGDSPDWNKRSGDGSSPVQGLIFRAFAEWVANSATAKKVAVPSEEAIRAKYDAMDRKGKLALRSIPEVAVIIERMKSERPAKASETVDTSALLSELGV